MIKKFLPLLVIVGMAVSFFGPLSGQASALSGPDFRPGRIIDDVIFTNKDAMNPTQIQAFLNSKVPACDTNHATYVGSSGTTYYPPYTCLKDYVENPTNGDNNYGRPTYNVPGGKSAAQIIWEAGQAHGINPQVLIVTLQKEQGLVTDDWPIMPQFTKAMGYLCPDTAPCSASAGGFYKQMAGAAWQFRHDLDGIGTPGYWSPYARGMNNILYNPAGAAACGTRSVNIESQATAVLYKYTPYTPNDATLALVNDSTAGGTAPCGAYGNRNFWWYFNKWFGSTLVPSFSAQLVYQSPYPAIRAGQTTQVVMSYKNTGSVLWRDDRTANSFGQFPIHLATASPTNRNSIFSAGWPSSARPALTFNNVYDMTPSGPVLASDQTVTNPGQVAEFVFSITAPSDLSSWSYRESFFPVREGTSSWYMGGLSWLDVAVLPTSYSPTFSGQSNYPTVKAGEVVDSYFDVKNSGNTTWYDEQSKPVGIAPLRLATQIPVNRSSKFSQSWASNSRPSLLFGKVFEADGVTLAPNQHVAQPNQIVRFNIRFTIPTDTTAGLYREFFSPILEGASNWDVGKIMWQDINVAPTTYSASYYDQSNYPTIARGSSTDAFFVLKNTGNATWKDSTSAPAGTSPVHLATTNPINKPSVFASAGWAGASRPNLTFSKVYESDGTTLAADQHTVAPNQIAKFEFNLSAPAGLAPAVYREYFTPILEGAEKWSLGPTLWLDVTVN